MAVNVVIGYIDARDVPERLAPLDTIGARVWRTHDLSAPEVAEAVREADGLIVELKAVPAEMIAELRRCRAIVCASTGYDYVDWRAAAARGIWVANVPDYCTEEVALHTISLLLAWARRLAGLWESVRAGDWNPQVVRPIQRLRGQVLGIIGLGRIGKSVAGKARALGMEVIAHDPYVDDAAFAAHGVRRVEREALLRAADYVSLHTPLTDETRGMIDAGALALMKPTAMLINTARGRLVDEAALAKAVRTGQIAAAALDVLATEPPPPDHPLLHEPRIFVTPHSAWCSEEADREVWVRAADEVVRVLRGERPRHAVTDVMARPKQ